MVAATAVAVGGDAPAGVVRRARPRRMLRPHELLACAGAAMVGFWPGTTLSSTHLIVVSACFVPIGLRTLLRLEESVTIPVPNANHVPSLVELGPVLRHTRTGLALLDLGSASDGAALPRVHQANPAYHELAATAAVGADTGEEHFDPRQLFVASAAARIEAALADLGAGHTTAWTGVLGLSGRCDGHRWVQLELVRLPDDEAGQHPRIALSMVRRDAPAQQPNGCAPAGWARGRGASGVTEPAEDVLPESA